MIAAPFSIVGPGSMAAILNRMHADTISDASRVPYSARLM
jgi:hypothetical protein